MKFKTKVHLLNNIGLTEFKTKEPRLDPTNSHIVENLTVEGSAS